MPREIVGIIVDYGRPDEVPRWGGILAVHPYKLRGEWALQAFANTLTRALGRTDITDDQRTILTQLVQRAVALRDSRTVDGEKLREDLGELYLAYLHDEHRDSYYDRSRAMEELTPTLIGALQERVDPGGAIVEHAPPIRGIDALGHLWKDQLPLSKSLTVPDMEAGGKIPSPPKAPTPKPPAEHSDMEAGGKVRP